MTKIEVFDIIFHQGKRVFYAGNTLAGEVVLQLAEPITVNAITINVTGGAEVYWTSLSAVDSRGKASHNQTTRGQYRNWENYINYKKKVFETDSGKDAYLPTGRSTFAFQYTLPTNIPSTLEMGYGKICYNVRAILDRPWKFSEEVKRPFTVIFNLGLNTHPNSMAPKRGSCQQTLCCLCCQTGPITADFGISRRGYVPGEFIDFQGEVVNGSNKTIKATKVQLRMHQSFRAMGNRTIKIIRVITTVKKGSILPGCRADWSGTKIHIPPLPPSPFAYCDIMSINYLVVLVVETLKTSSAMEVPLKLIIGTKPLENVPAIDTPECPNGEAIRQIDDVACSEVVSGEIDEEFKRQLHDQPPKYETIDHMSPPSYEEIGLKLMPSRDDRDSPY